MKLTKKDQLRHGMTVTCKIEGVQIDDAQISIDQKGQTYICQNKKDGTDAPDKLGYNYSWVFNYDGKSGWLQSVTDLVSIKKTCQHLVYGDYIALDGYRRKVLGRLHDIIFVSRLETEDNEYWESECSKHLYTWQELERAGASLVEEKKIEEIIELTMKEIADLKGIPVEKLRVKE